MKKDNYVIMMSTFLQGVGLSLQFYFATIKAGKLINPIISTLMMGIYFATASIANILVGKMSDKLQKRKVFGIFGSFMTGIVCMLYFFTTDMYVFFLGSFLLGISFSFITATIPALFTEIETEMEKGKLVSLYNMSNSAGWAFATLFGEIVFIFIQDYIFIVFAFFPILGGILLLGVRDSSEFEKPIKIKTPEFDKEHYDLIKPFLIFLAIALAFRHLASQGTIISLLPNYMVLELSATELERGIIFSLNMWLQIILMLPMGYLVDKIGRKYMLLFGVVGTMTCAFGYGLSMIPWHLIPVQILMAFSWTAIINSSAAYIIDVTNESDRAKGMGYLNAGLSIGGTIGPFMAGFSLFIFSHNFTLSFMVISLFAIPGIILLLFIKENRQTHVYTLFNKQSKLIKNKE